MHFSIQYRLVQKQIGCLTNEIQQLIMGSIHSFKEQNQSLIKQELHKINTELYLLKNTLYSMGLQKSDLQTTFNSDNNKNKFEFQSVLVQNDTASSIQFLQIKCKIQDLVQRFNQWFSVPHQKSKIDTLQNQFNIKKSKIYSQIQAKCQQMVGKSEKTQFMRLSSIQSVFQKRMDQLNRTLYNILEMLNQSQTKSIQLSKGQQNLSKSHLINSTLNRQSSMQNLKVKKFFNFGFK